MNTSTLLVVITFLTVLSSFVNAQTITGIFQCKSIIIDAAQGANQLSVAFTTPSTIAGRNPQLPFNGEFKSSDDPNLPFASYWVLFSAGTAMDLGVLGFASAAITLDSDGNGIPNFAERQLAANVVGDIVTISALSGQSSGGTISLSRGAGRETGTAVARFGSGVVFTGTWRIPILDIAGTYDSALHTMRIRTTSAFWASGNMTGSYTRVADDTVSFGNIVYRLDAGPVITSTPITFTRFGKTYRAIVEFLDGNIIGNTFPDFQRWTLQITDPTDSDNDGIPDLSDETPLGQPPTIASGPLGRTVGVGQAAGFTVIANGRPPFQYQWYHNGVPIAGATASSYTIAAAKLTDAGSYTVTVRNSAGEVRSAPALLTVSSPQSALLLSYRREANGKVTLSWTGTGKLARASVPEGPYADVANAATGHQFTPTGASGFYRLRP